MVLLVASEVLKRGILHLVVTEVVPVEDTKKEFLCYSVFEWGTKRDLEFSVACLSIMFFAVKSWNFVGLICFLFLRTVRLAWLASIEVEMVVWWASIEVEILRVLLFMEACSKNQTEGKNKILTQIDVFFGFENCTSPCRVFFQLDLRNNSFYFSSVAVRFFLFCKWQLKKEEKKKKSILAVL